MDEKDAKLFLKDAGKTAEETVERVALHEDWSTLAALSLREL
jgi:hypothetical protein